MTTIITYPSNQGFPGFTKYTFTLSRKSMSLRSPFTGKRQTLNHPYALWAFKGSYSMCDTVNASLLRSFLAQLQGQANAFNLPLPDYVKPSTGYAGAAGTVNGASQTGASLITHGWTASAAIFNPGDYFTLLNATGNPELKMVTAAATADGSGNCTISFTPNIRISPTNGSALVVANPYVCLCSNSDDTASWDLTPPILYSASLDCLECVE